MMFKSFLFTFLVLFSVSSFAGIENQFKKNEMDELRDGVGIDEKLGDKIDLNLKFKNEQGEEVSLGSYFQSGKPVMLALVYFNCPSLCNFQLNGIVETLKKLEWTTGNEFEFVIASIEPTETPDLAKSKKESYMTVYDRKEGAKGWHFLTGSQESITALADQVGFRYKWVESRNEYAHTAATYVLTPEGKISRYLYGIGFTPKTLRLSLVEASNNKIGNAVDRFLLYCFRYDPEKRGYAFYAFNIMRAGAAVSVVALLAFLVPFWIRQRKQRLKENS
ncbi:MAG: photosynthetic protein synthase I [Bdellovibrionaceae bacterium]|nr:photosynthetic protein synthase I [Pseudobdellovibrionaceae bacterium]